MSNAEEFYKKGLNAKQNRSWELAINYFSKSIEHNSANADAYYQRGVAHYWSDNLDKSIYDCRKCIELKPEYVEAYFSLGRLYEKAGRAQDAIGSYNQFLEKASSEDFAKKITEARARIEKLQ